MCDNGDENTNAKIKALQDELDKLRNTKSIIDPVVLASANASMDLYNKWYEMETKIQQNSVDIQEQKLATLGLQSYEEKKKKLTKSLNEKMRNNEIEIKELQQHKVQNDVFLTGFFLSPNMNILKTELTARYGDVLTALKDIYPVSIKQKNGRISYSVIMEFIKQADKQQFTQKYAKNPLLIKHVEPKNTLNQEHKIFVLPRLSKFNRMVQFHLSILKRNGNIFDCKLKGHFYSYQATKISEWFTILTDR